MALVNIQIDDNTQEGSYLLGIAKLLAKQLSTVKIEHAIAPKKHMKQAIRDLSEIKLGKQKTMTVDEMLKSL
ncbi:MAG: hypothetical protein AB8B61_09900 [Cyclobacteriaceae bacterium]